MDSAIFIGMNNDQILRLIIPLQSSLQEIIFGQAKLLKYVYCRNIHDIADHSNVKKLAINVNLTLLLRYD